MLPFLIVATLKAFLLYVASIVSSVGIILGGMKGASVFFKKRINKKKNEETAKLRKIIIEDVKKAMEPQFQELKDSDSEFRSTLSEMDKKIDLLTASNRDILRTDIERIYTKYKHVRKISETDREILDKLYYDYKNENGNGRIERMYLRTVDWEVVPDDEEIF